MSLYNGQASVVCLSVRLSVNFCANHFFSQANGRITTKLSQDGLRVSMHPGCAQGQGQVQRLRNTGTFVLALKSLLLPGKWPDRDQTCTRWSTGKPAYRVFSRSRSRSKVTWYAHFLGFLEWATPPLTVWFKHTCIRTLTYSILAYVYPRALAPIIQGRSAIFGLWGYKFWSRYKTFVLIMK